MSPDKISQRVVSDRLEYINRMLTEIRLLPIESYKAFKADNRNIWSAESCLRRSIEALMDLGRHILAKGFGQGVSEYKEIAILLNEVDVLNEKERDRMKILAGYRNRMVHYYHEISEKEIFEICSSQLSDIEYVVDALKTWINNNPDMTEKTL